MMEIAVQSLCAFLIIVIGITTFKNKKEPITVMKMSYLAMFLTLAVVISMFSLSTVLLGGRLVFSLGQLPMVVLGAVLGPFYAFIGGLARDGIGLITSPTAFPFLGFTLNKILVPLIPALTVKYLKKDTSQLLRGVVNAYFIYFLIIVLMFKFESMQQRLLLLTLIVFVLTVVNVLFNKYQEKIFKDRNLSSFYIGIVLVELLVQGMLTPFWLSVMYQTPFVVSAFMRLVKGVVLIAMNAIIGGQVVRLASIRMNGNKRV